MQDAGQPSAGSVGQRGGGGGGRGGRATERREPPAAGGGVQPAAHLPGAAEPRGEGERNTHTHTLSSGINTHDLFVKSVFSVVISFYTFVILNFAAVSIGFLLVMWMFALFK